MGNISIEDNLVKTRPRRSTAGNRMALALVEFASVGLEVEQEDDRDFIVVNNEEEIFDSDFQSTDEDEADEDETAAEKETQVEERLERKVHRNRIAKNIEISVARQRVSTQSIGHPRPQQSKLRMMPKTRRVSVGFALDVETGKIVEATSKRKSRRHSTMLSSQILHSRLKVAEERRALMTQKRPRESVHIYSQAELIARALDTEEGNILEHRDYLAQEEEKRARARAVRKSLSGPVLRWISRVEDERVQRTSPTPHPDISSGHDHPNSQGDTWMSAGYPPYQPPEQQTIRSNGSTIQEDALPFSQPATEKVCKNYLIHEVDQQVNVPRPSWVETMTCIFGSHVKWEEVKAYLGKHRPLSRPVTRCPLTGQTAIYRDPRSGVPYANVSAFKTLTHLLYHQYVWDENLKCYTVDGLNIG